MEQNAGKKYLHISFSYKKLYTQKAYQTIPE